MFGRSSVLDARGGIRDAPHAAQKPAGTFTLAKSAAWKQREGGERGGARGTGRGLGRRRGCRCGGFDRETGTIRY